MPTIKIHNITTDEIIEREMNAEELVEWQAEQDLAEAATAAKAEAEAARQALLDKLGITADEAKLLLG